MKGKSLGLLTAVVACAAAVSFTIASCDSNATDPANPGVSGRGKGPRVSNDTRSHTIGVDRSGIGESVVEFNINGSGTVVENFNSGGVSSIPDAPGTVWSQDVDFNIDASADGGVGLRSIADNDETSSIDITSSAEGAIAIAPSYTGQSDPVFHVIMYDNNNEIGRIRDIPVGTSVLAYPVNPGNPCCWIRRWGFTVHPTSGSCIWSLVWNPCCYWRIFWNGQWYEFNRADFVEGVDGGHYPYHHFTEIQAVPINGGVSGSFTIGSEFVVNAQ